MQRLILGVGMGLAVLFALAACGGSGARGGGDPDLQGCTRTEDCIGDTYCNPLTHACEPIVDGDGTQTYPDCESCLSGTTCEPTSDAQTEFVCVTSDGDDEPEDVEIPSYKCPIIATVPEAGKSLSFGAVTSTTVGERSLQITNDSNLPDMLLKIYNFFIFDMKTGAPSQAFWIKSLTLPSGDDILWDAAKEPIASGKPIIELKQGQTLKVNLVCSASTTAQQISQFTITSNACDANSIRSVFLTTDFKGRSKIKVEYEDPTDSNLYKAVSGATTVDFGNVDLNSQAKVVKFKVSNSAWTKSDNKPLVITSIGLREGFGRHFRVLEGPGDAPWVIEADAFKIFKISYLPQTLAPPFNPLVSTVQIFNNSDDPLQRLFEYDVSGSADSSALSVVPWPLDFGRTVATKATDKCSADGPTDPYDLTCPQGNCCPLYEICLRRSGSATGYCYMPLDPMALISNYTGIEYLVMRVGFSERTGDSPNCADHFYAPTYEDDQQNTDERWNSLQGKTLAVGSNTSFPLYYRPEVPTARQFKENCTLDVTLKNPLDSTANQTIHFAAQGLAVKANVDPVANLSPTSHGEQINAPIQNIPLDGTHNQLCFWADLSSDFDMKDDALCGGMDYTWLLTDGDGRELPYGTVLDVIIKDCRGRPSGPQIIGRCYTFQKPGSYRLTLVTTDDDHATSIPKVVEIKINGNESMMAILTFQCGGGSFTTNTLNMNLRITSPNTMLTVDESRLRGYTGDFGSDGVASFIEVSPSCQTGGSTESAIIRDIKDGYWTFGAKYIDDCDKLLTALTVPVCVGSIKNNTFRLQLFAVPYQGSTRTQVADVTDTISKGQAKNWRILREAGVFRKETFEKSF